MNQRVGQVRTGEAIVGLAAIALAVVGLALLCQWLLPPASQEISLPEPDPFADATCADLRAQLPDAGPAEPASSDLFECPDVFDGVDIRYRGEVVGPVLQRGARTWLQLNDDAYGVLIGPLPEHRTAVGGNSGVAVSVPTALAAQLSRPGSHTDRGDVVEVDGEFRRADPDDAGGPTIHARSARVLRRGTPIPNAVSQRMVVAAGVAFALACVPGAALWWRRRRRF